MCNIALGYGTWNINKGVLRKWINKITTLKTKRQINIEAGVKIVKGKAMNRKAWKNTQRILVKWLRATSSLYCGSRTIRKIRRKYHLLFPFYILFIYMTKKYLLKILEDYWLYNMRKPFFFLFINGKQFQYDNFKEVRRLFIIKYDRLLLCLIK